MDKYGGPENYAETKLKRWLYFSYLFYELERFFSRDFARGGFLYLKTF